MITITLTIKRVFRIFAYLCLGLMVSASSRAMADETRCRIHLNLVCDVEISKRTKYASYDTFCTLERKRFHWGSFLIKGNRAELQAGGFGWRDPNKMDWDATSVTYIAINGAKYKFDFKRQSHIRLASGEELETCKRIKKIPEWVKKAFRNR